MLDAFPNLVHPARKKSGVDLRLRDRRETKVFGLDVLRAYSPPLLPMDKLLAALRAFKWTKHSRPNVFPRACDTILAHAGNHAAHILELACDAAPRRDFEYAQLNRNVEMTRRVDKYNRDDSLIVLLGDFEGGALCWDDGRRIEQKGVWHTFDGQSPHWVEPFTGERFSVILFNSVVLRRLLAQREQGRETQRCMRQAAIAT